MKVIDLTMPIDEKTPVFPGDLKQEIRQVATIGNNGWNEKRIAFNSHFSTHIDAPFHMIEGGKKLTDFPVEHFLGDAVVVDARGQKQISSDLGGVKRGDIVFFCTNHGKKAYSESFFKDNPVITNETAAKLIENKVRMVGLDSYSPDNEPFEIHKMLLKRDILIVENLVNLDRLVGKRFRCYVMPLKIQDADGAPCRVIGIIE
jgi:kynurenine formamidase